MDYGDEYWGFYREYYRDPFPHSLPSTRQCYSCPCNPESQISSVSVPACLNHETQSNECHHPASSSAFVVKARIDTVAKRVEIKAVVMAEQSITPDSRRRVIVVVKLVVVGGLDCGGAVLYAAVAAAVVAAA